MSRRLLDSYRYLAVALLALAWAGAAHPQDDSRFTVSNFSSKEGNTGTTGFEFDVELQVPISETGDFCTPIEFGYETVPGTADYGDDDYERTHGGFVLEYGGRFCTSRTTVTVSVIGDGIEELNETFLLKVRAVVGERAEIVYGTGTILNDDTAMLSIRDAELLEGNSDTTDAVFTLSLTNERDVPTSVDFQTADGTATAPSDYQMTMGTVTIPARTFEGTISVTVNGDRFFEPDETFFVFIDSKVKIVDSEGEGTILNDDPEPTLSIDDVEVPEGNSRTTDAIFTVSLSSPLKNDVSIDYATEDGTATAPSDYQATSGSVTILKGDLEAPIPVVVNGDTFFEDDETFFVNIEAAGGPPIDDGQGQGTILNDDEVETLSIDDVSLMEGDSGLSDAVFTVSLSSPREDDVFIDFATADGTASAGPDYRATEGREMIEAGDTTTTIEVPVVGDVLSEPNETFFVNIESVEGPPIADGQGVGTILNDDGVAVLSIDDVSVPEGNTSLANAVFTVSLSVPSAVDVFVDFATSNGTAKRGADYRKTEGRVVIPAGETSATIEIPVDGDTDVEADESFFVNLVGSSGPPIARARGVATIVNDDLEPETSEIRLSSVPTVSEGVGSAEVLVVRSGASSGAASVTVTVSSGTATAGADFEAVDTVVSWSSGETGTRSVDVAILDDSAVEGDETAAVALSAPSGASLGTPATGELRILDDDTAEEVEVVGETESTATVEAEAELSVRVLDGEGNPVENALVEWAVEGGAELVGGPEDRTDSEGISSRTLELGDVPGTVVVTATLAATGQTIRFTVVVEGNLGELFPESGPETGEASVAAVLDTACVSATGQFGEFCTYLFTLPGPADQLAVLGEITPEEIPAQGTMSLESAQIQLRNIGSRLAALRSGATRQAVTQLALDINGRPVPWEAIVAAMAPAKELELPDFAEAFQDAEEEEPAAATDVADLDAQPRLGFFINGRVSMGDRGTTSNEEGFDVDAQGVTVGIDYRASDRFVFGGALGYLDTDLELVADGGGLDAEGTALAAYATYFREAFYLDWVVAFGENEYDVVRHVDLPIPFQGQSRWIARGSPDSSQFSLAMSGGYDRPVGAATLGFFGKASYVDADVDGYSETGGGPFNVFIREQDITSLLGEAGLEFLRSVSRNWGVMQPSVRLAYLHEFDDDTRLIRGGFLGDLSANEFVLATDPPDRDFFNLGAGLTFVFTKGRSCYVYYDTDLERDDLEIFTLSAGFRWEF